MSVLLRYHSEASEALNTNPVICWERFGVKAEICAALKSFLL